MTDATHRTPKRRRPTTLDLKATEIASEPVQPAEPIEKTAETPRAEPAPEAAAAASPGPSPAPGATAWRPEWLDAAAMNARFSGLRDRFDWRVAAAGATGAAVMFLLFLVVWAAGAFSPRDDRTAPLERTDRRSRKAGRGSRQQAAAGGGRSACGHGSRRVASLPPNRR